MSDSGFGKRPDFVKDKKPVAMDADNELHMKDLASRLSRCKLAKKELEAQVTELNKEIDAIDTELSELMQARGVDLFRISGVGTFFTQVVNYPSVSNTEEFVAWLDANGMGAMAKRTVHPQTLKGWVNDRLREGLDVGPHVNNFQKVRVNTRKA
jgi:hypothetical protein